MAAGNSARGGASRAVAREIWIGRGEERKARMRFRAEAPLHCLRNAQLADTRLARDQDDTTVASFRLPSAASEARSLLRDRPAALLPCAGVLGVARRASTRSRANPVILY
jgi:hypothetical protein